MLSDWLDQSGILYYELLKFDENVNTQRYYQQTRHGNDVQSHTVKAVKYTLKLLGSDIVHHSQNSSKFIYNKLWKNWNNFVQKPCAKIELIFDKLYSFNKYLKSQWETNSKHTYFEVNIISHQVWSYSAKFGIILIICLLKSSDY